MQGNHCTKASVLAFTSVDSIQPGLCTAESADRLQRLASLRIALAEPCHDGVVQMSSSRQPMGHGAM